MWLGSACAGERDSQHLGKCGRACAGERDSQHLGKCGRACAGERDSQHLGKCAWAVPVLVRERFTTPWQMCLGCACAGERERFTTPRQCCRACAGEKFTIPRWGRERERKEKWGREKAGER